jgi:prepilin-type processing-associated H-X9-DG protein
MRTRFAFWKKFRHSSVNTTVVTTVVRPWFGRDQGSSNLARECDSLGAADRADARGWRAAPRPNHALTCVVTTRRLARSGGVRREVSKFLVRVMALIIVASLSLTPAVMGQEPPKPAASAPLARYFPRQDLVVYAEFEGLDAHRDAWNKSAAYRLLSETTTGAMLEHSIVQVLDLVLASQPQAPATSDDFVALGKHLLRSGFALGINRAGGVGLPRCLAVVIRGGASGPPRAILHRLLQVGEGPRNRVKRVEKPGGRSVQVLGDVSPRSVAWWSEGNDLVVSLVSPLGVDAIIAALDGREPDAVDHPNRLALKKSDDASGFEPVGLAFFDMAALPPLPREAVALGLDGIKRLDYRWGFHGPAIQSIVAAVVPAPRRGIPALFDQPTFDVRHLPPLPGGLSGFTVLSLDSARLYDQVIAAIRAIDPRDPQPQRSLEAAVQQAAGLKLREEILAPLGSRIVLYTFPTRMNAPNHMLASFAYAFVFVPKSTVAIEVKDREAMARALNTLAEHSGRRAPVANRPGMGMSVSVVVPPMRRLKGPDLGYVFAPLEPTLPLPIGTRLTMLLGHKDLIFGSSPATARRARDLSEQGKPGLPPDDALAGALEQLPDRLTFLTVSDTRQSMLPDVLVSLPSLIDSLAAGRSPAIFPFFGMGMRRMFVPGMPGPVATPPSRAAFDPELIPEPDALRPFLFPGVSAIAVDDQGIQFLSRAAFPTINPTTAVPVAIAMLVPAVSSARVAAQRADSVMNLKQIGLAMHNFLSTNNHFPGAVCGKDGKPLLSWRVQILPFLEQQALFNEFKLDEPWDSPHNKALLERMPNTFAVPNSPAEPGMTFYRGFAGPHTLFDPKVPAGVKIESITDGTSNTIAVVEAKEAVPWTKPESGVPFDESLKPERLQALRDALGGHFPRGFNALFCDGSVRFLKDSISLQVLRALITRDGGEVISSDSF